MLFTFLSILILCVIFLAHSFHKKVRIKRFLRGIVSLYFRHCRDQPSDPAEALQLVINSRYARSTDARNRKNVQILWDEYLAAVEAKEGPEATSEKEHLLKLIRIISLVENQDYLSTGEAGKKNLFDHYYETLGEEAAPAKDSHHAA